MWTRIQNYFNAEPILLHLFPNFEELPDEEKDSKLEKVRFGVSRYNNRSL